MSHAIRMDDLDAEIAIAAKDDDAAQAEAAAARVRATECEKRAELTRLRLETLRRAADLRPVRPDSYRFKAESAGGNRGRQPGAISKEWRAILTAMAARHPSGADDAEIAEIAREMGLPNVRPKDARDRMANYEGHHYVEPSSKGWRVTPHALAKFGSGQEDETETADAA